VGRAKQTDLFIQSSPSHWSRWNLEQLSALAPELATLGVAMIEQPLPRGGDAELENYRSPVPLGADESCLGVAEFEQAARRYQVINIKLDKTGGLTEALELARLAEERGIELMVGNMMGTSLAMAPGFAAPTPAPDRSRPGC
jgi:L-alanine-DL-glutamate epimerase-like enolase superfamily enzyme